MGPLVAQMDRVAHVMAGRVIRAGDTPGVRVGEDHVQRLTGRELVIDAIISLIAGEREDADAEYRALANREFARIPSQSVGQPPAMR